MAEYFFYGGLPAEPLPGIRTATLGSWAGYILQRNDFSPREFPDADFQCHIVAVESNPSPFRVTWRENGVDRYTDTGAGNVFVRSQQPLRALRITGTQRTSMLMIDPTAMQMALPEPYRARAVELTPRSIGPDAVVNHLIGALEAELAAEAPGGALMLQSLGDAISLYMASHYSTGCFGPPAVTSGLSSDRLSRVLEYMDAHITEELGIDELAGIACLSSYHFGRMFKRSTGQTVHQFVLRRRIEHSRTLLKRNDLTLSEIAAACGFGSQSRFTTAFRRSTGYPPAAWRRELGLQP